MVKGLFAEGAYNFAEHLYHFVEEANSFANCKKLNDSFEKKTDLLLP